MSISTEFYGKTADGCDITLYYLTNNQGVQAQIINYGANLIKLIVPDREGNQEDVVLGYDNLHGYENNAQGFGSFIGRCANRIGGASFELNGKVYPLQVNDNKNTLHGGTPGYNKVVYEATAIQKDDADSLELCRVSPDQEQGFPGNLSLKITYTLTNDNELIMEYEAKSDQDTVVNLTNHSYFNLAGHKSGSVLEQKVWIDADEFTPTDGELIPTGEIAKVEGTPMDFRTEKTISKDWTLDYEPMKLAGGYDHNFVLKTSMDTVSKVASLYEEQSGREMEVYTNMPGMQMYTANFLSDTEGLVNKEQVSYASQDAVCFETQFYPNAVNQPNFPTSILKAGETGRYITKYVFSTRK